MPRHAGLTEDVTRRVEDFVVVLLTAAVLRLHRAAHELATKSPLRLLGTAEGQRSLANASLLVQRFAGVSAEPVLGEPGGRASRPPPQGPRLLVVGLSERWRQEGLGPTRSQIARTAPAPILFVRRGTRPGALAPRTDVTRFAWSSRR